MGDSSLKQDIIDELEFEPRVDATKIGVAVDGGIVTLSGWVESYPQKLAAERAVMRVHGVKGIAEEIEVRPDSFDGVSDDEIARRAIAALHWSTLIPDDRVTVKVEHGMVTLSGTVDWAYQKRGALQVVRDLRGVTSVADLIELNPRVAPADVKTAIERALHRNAEIDEKTIDVGVAGGCVTLSGRVKTWRGRRVAENAAWSVPGVINVNDELAVG
ncbi:MAG: BON domain-containing protein [Devosia sp.]|jgi:osmotically-inducible protein OsmY|nr:BON domain-containing protein [Devosia sp.]